MRARRQHGVMLVIAGILGAAVGLFNSAINLVILLVVNRLSKRVTEVGLW